MRTIGIDMGTRRVGVAISDTSGTVAVSRTVIARPDGDDSHLATLAALVQETAAEVVVVGLPLSLDGSVGPAARWAQEEAAKLAAVLDVPVELHDERLTTVAAGRSPTRHDRRSIDARAAVIMLQSWLDARRREAG